MFDILHEQSTILNPIHKHSCDISEEDFVHKFIRTRTPVILTDCEGFERLQQFHISVEALAKVTFQSIIAADSL